MTRMGRIAADKNKQTDKNKPERGLNRFRSHKRFIPIQKTSLEQEDAGRTDCSGYSEQKKV